MKLKKYLDFLFPINESAIVYSDKLKQILKKIDSPVATRLLEIEGEDIPLTNNYFDIADNKNQISFISDRKAQEILSSEESKKVTHMGSGHLRHSEANREIFDGLGYIPEGPQTYHPQSNEEGVIESEYASQISSNVYCKVVFPGGISVINKGRLRPVDLSKEPFKKSRQPGRVGATIQTILRQSGGDFSNSEVEQFVNKYKSEFDRFNDAFRNFELVSGNDIHRWYQYDNYLHGTSKGQLSNSCMARAPRRWLEIYTENPDVCNLLILKDDEQQDKIKGRALVWKLIEPAGITYVDRIYTHDDSDLELYKQYIAQQGWYLKKRYTSSTSDTTMIAPDGSEMRPRELLVKVQDRDYGGYPYLDTFKFYTPHTGKLSTDSGDYQLEDTGGGYSNQECEYCDGNGNRDCYECEGSGREDCGDCDGNGQYECSDCSGRGHTSCDDCEGRGERDCPTCDGSGGDASSEPCADCDGSGKLSCDDCSGSGRVDCDTCDSDGVISCGVCNTSGRVSCSYCEGDGTVSCPECN
jgi:hypothetical protein